LPSSLQAHSHATSFADGQIDQVDLIHLTERTDFAGKDSLEAAVRSCVKYRSATSIEGANGLALYFPYDEVSSCEGMRSTLAEISCTKPTEFYDYFLSIMGSSTGPLPETGTGSIPSSIQSAISSAAGSDEAVASASDSDFAADALDGSSWLSDVSESFAYDELPSSLELAETDDGYVVEMDDTLWDVLGDFQVSVMQRNPKNGDEYTLLGSDNVWIPTQTTASLSSLTAPGPQSTAISSRSSAMHQPRFLMAPTASRARSLPS
jgi:hypothetical protein